MTLHDLILKLYSSDQIREIGDGEIAVCCPFCISRVGKIDAKYRLGINVVQGVSHCYRCDFRGNLQKTFSSLNNVFGQSYRLSRLESETSEIKRKPKEKAAREEKISLPDTYEPLWKKVNDPIGRMALHYALQRGLTREQLKTHKVGFCAVGKYAYRLIFPVFSRRKVVGIVGRDFSGKSELRYLNSLGKKTLYNLPSVRKRSVCNLSEGLMDALSIERGIGKYEDSVAVLGSSLTAAQVKLLRGYDEIVIWPDPNKPGVEGAIKTILALGKKVKISVVVDYLRHEDRDPGSLLPEEVQRYRQHARPFTPTIAALLRLRVKNGTMLPKKVPHKDVEKFLLTSGQVHI